MSTETRDTIFIGKKPLMAYVTSTLIQLANVPSVNIKARGLSIGRAVDVAQIVARKTENAGVSDDALTYNKSDHIIIHSFLNKLSFPRKRESRNL